MVDDVAGSFNPDDAESMFFYTGEVEYRVRHAAWSIVGEAVVDTDSSIVSKSITLYVGQDYANLYLLTLELDDFLLKHNRGSFDDYIGELKDLI